LTRLNRRRTRFAIGLVYHTPADKALALPEVLKELVEENDAVLIRCGFTGFGDSALQFVLEFDILSADFEEVFAARHRIGLAVFRTLHERGYEFAYPTQTTYTASPDGTMIMPYAPPMPAKDAVRSAPQPEKSL
jgi:small-conductance mechanosensitive channel